MDIRNTMQIKEIDDLEPGDLFYFELERARALAILITKIEHQPILAGVLSADYEPEAAPFLISYKSPISCASLGRSWEIEAIPDENTWPGNSDLRDRSGAFHFLNGSAAIRFGKELGNPRNVGFSLDLKTMRPANLSSNAYAPTLRWRLWAGKQSPRHAGEVPIFDFEG